MSFPFCNWPLSCAFPVFQVLNKALLLNSSFMWASSRTYIVWLQLRACLTSHEVFFCFLRLEEERVVHATYGLFDHVLGTQSLASLFCHILPIVLHIDSEHVEKHASAKHRKFQKIISQSDRWHVLSVFGIHGLRCWIADLDGRTLNERLFPWLQVRFVPFWQKSWFCCLIPVIPLKIMLSYPPDQHSASALGSLKLADSNRMAVWFASSIRSVRMWCGSTMIFFRVLPSPCACDSTPPTEECPCAKHKAETWPLRAESKC